MNPSEIKTVFQQLGGGANKRLGQHFLIDAAALQAMADHAPNEAGTVVLEIGPGLGVLTRALVAKGCDVIALERDRRFLDYLATEIPSIRLVSGDAAEIDWMTLVGNRSWSLVSNLPYAISSLALRLALWSPRPADRVVVLVQREVAQRAIDVAPDGKTSLLSLMIALASQSARIVRRVPAGAFFPPPKVESAILEIQTMPVIERSQKWGIDPERIMVLAKIGFAHPRKMLIGNLATGGVLAKDELLSLFARLGFAQSVRAEDLAPAQWAQLARALA